MTAQPNVDDLVDQLTLAEQVSLLAGTDFWHTAAVERLGIPALRVTDGPTGARGTKFHGGPKSVNVPCSTSLAATWDTELVAEIGHLLGREVRAKGARILLAPTVNLHRTPVGGRNFECMSEDPYLTARTAVAYVEGVQAEGVGSCIKHFVGNDTEFERNSIDSRIDERTLRELYLVPFEAAVKEAGVASVMTSYNRINGPYAADSAELVDGVLRAEWGFDGLVMSDWFGLHSTVDGVVAGLDLEMPGPTNYRGQALVDAVERGDAPRAAVRAAARNVLAAVARWGGWEDGAPGPETTRDEPVDRALLRRAAAAGTVLVRNEDGALPMTAAGLRRAAVIGPNALDGQIMGGGSAQVNPVHVSHPYDALRERLDAAGVEVVHARGCLTHKRLPALPLRLCEGSSVAYYASPDDLLRAGAEPALVEPARTAHFMWERSPVGGRTFGARFTASFTPDVSGRWTFAITSVNPARFAVDGVTVLDNVDVPLGGSFFGMGRAEVSAEVEMEVGRTYAIEALLFRQPTEQSMSGLHLGAFPPQPGDLMAEAVDAAASADVSVVVVGTNADWESEGWDREDLDLPGRQDELVRRVAEVSARTIVVVNAGSPVAMPWLDEVDAVLVVWFPGQEMGDALADVLLGDVEPEGRLPVTFPRRLEDTPAFEHHPGRNGVAPYLERRLIGYRWYDTVGREPLFPFGFGLGYAPTVVEDAAAVDDGHVQVRVRNDGSRDGATVVQVYAHQLDRTGLPPDEPDQRLVGFVKVVVPAGAAVTALVELDPRSFQGWSVDRHAWVDGAGAYELRVGTSSRHVAARLRVRGLNAARPMRIVVDGVPLEVRAGDTVAVGLVRAGQHPGHGGTLCLEGDCGNCVAEVDGVGYVRTCQTPTRPGMVVRRHPPVGGPTIPEVPTTAPVTSQRSTADVVVVGGGRSGRAEFAAARAAGREAVLLDARNGAEVVGVYAGPTVIVRTPTGMRHLSAGEVVIATGAAELHPVCPGDGLRGIVTRRAAEALAAAGVSLGRVVAVGTPPTGVGGVTVAAGELVRFEGDGSVRAVVVRDAAGEERSHACDTVAVGLGAAPRDVLVRSGAVHRGVRAVGSAAASFPLPSAPVAGVVCPCARVEVDDLAGVWDRGFRDLELVKRASLCGTGTCQGAVCGPHLQAFVAERSGARPEPFTARPVARQLTIGEAAAGAHPEPFKRSPLHDEHVRLGAVMDRWGGWWRPWHYGDHVAEYWAVREGVSLGDVSTLGKLVVDGPDTVEALERLYPTALADLRPGRSRYALLLNERGHVIDDGLVVRESDSRFVLTFTSGGAADAEMWIRDWIETWGLRVHVLDRTGALGAINVTGPYAAELLRRAGLADAPRFGEHRHAEVAGVDCHVVRVGFTGEVSFELHHDADASVGLWQLLAHQGRSLGVRPHGLRALFGLRLEKGHVLVGVDTDLDTTPRRIGLERLVRMDKGDFVGRSALARTARLPDARRLVGLTMDGPAPIEGSPLYLAGQVAGHVTSAFASPALGRTVALGWLRSGWSPVEGPPSTVTVDGRTATVARPPFYDPDGVRARA